MKIPVAESDRQGRLLLPFRERISSTVCPGVSPKRLHPRL